MHPFTTLLALAVPLLAGAQNTVIQVGGTTTEAGGIFQFIPANVTVSQGDVVTFNFSGNPGNHSITQSSLTNPCTPLSDGFDSGWVFISGETPTPQWNLTITNASVPIWFYCKQLVPSPHCKVGMVGAINAPMSGNATFDVFLSNAKAFSGTPGQEVGALVGLDASASAAPGPIPSGASLFGSPAASVTATATGAGASASASGGTSSSSSAAGAGASSAALGLRASGLWAGVAMIMGAALT
ncbi:uncharacterized protein BT62DRAFT_451709 [Guyanagaster necrorhizus]|uniref:Cupredoxin n=1 Tax=Guyanagaster necrorhizus TaxID=856835 RepID=A0A9P7VJE4_9AGAR|nr:uncharacterized protein BT62DRAFT_451709 [Guyanagaster necrorhizus MCA 3950]KAG7442231.1 hypothetical protein BT62DRAFT_451709 [Guyanagaster necrorhizus MCA 3950]